MTKIKATSIAIGAIPKNLLVLGAGLALLGTGSAQAGVLTIDEFDLPTSGSQRVEICNRTGGICNPASTFPQFSQVGSFPTSSILGGYRDLQILSNSTTGSARAKGSAQVVNGNLNWSNAANVTTSVKVTWDGNDNSPNIAFPGLGNIDLTQGGTLNQILLGLTNDQPGYKVTVDVYSAANQFSRATTTLTTANPNNGPTKSVFLPFSGFTAQGSNGGANFNSVQAIQLLLEGPPDTDAAVKFIQAFGGTQLEYVGTSNPFENPNNPLYSPKLFEVEGRAGKQGPATYEFAIGPSGATGAAAPIPQTNPPQGPLTGQIDLKNPLNWGNGTDVPWELSWDKATGQAKFKIGTTEIVYPCLDQASSSNYTPGQSDNSCTTSPFPNAGKVFSRFGVIASARTQAGTVDPNSTIKLQIDTINDSPISFLNNYPNIGIAPNSILINATSQTPTLANPSGGQLNEYYFNSPTAITKMTGRASISWLGALDPTIGGQSLLDIKIKAYDPPEDLPANAPAISVPEPNAILGLLTVSLLGATSALKRR